MSLPHQRDSPAACVRSLRRADDSCGNDIKEPWKGGSPRINDWMRRIAVRIGVLALVIVVALGITLYLHGRSIQVRRGDIVSVRLVPIPEGPQTSSSFERAPSQGSGSQPLSIILDSIPIPLPHPAWQFGCSTGGTLEIELQDGRVVSYGPCHRPKSINHLWAVMIDILGHGACRPNCGPGGQPGP